MRMTVPQWIIEALRLRGADWRRRAKSDAYGCVTQRCGARANECFVFADYLACAVALGMERMPTTKEYDQWCWDEGEKEDKDDA